MDGASPSMRLFGHTLRSTLPANQEAFHPTWQLERRQVDRASMKAKKCKEYFDSSAHPLRPIKDNAPVRVQDPRTKRWTRTGVVIEKIRSRTYLVKLPSGQTLQKNRQALRPFTFRSKPQWRRAQG